MTKLKNHVTFKNIVVAEVVERNMKEAYLYLHDWADVPSVSSEAWLFDETALSAIEEHVASRYDFVDFDTLDIYNVVPTKAHAGVIAKVIFRIPVRKQVADDLLALDANITEKAELVEKLERKAKAIQAEAEKIRQEIQDAATINIP